MTMTNDDDYDDDDDDDDDDGDDDITIITIIRTLSIVFTACSFRELHYTLDGLNL